MSSVREIARKVGVSAATVSRAINNDPRVTSEMRERVLTAINRSRYVPRVGRRSTMNIAFLYTGDSSLGSPFDAALMQGMSDRMEDYGFDLMILSAQRVRLPGETFSHMFMRKGIRGAVLRSTDKTHHVCEEIAAEGFPAVVVGDRFESPTVSFIYSDSRATSREAVEHLIDLGHQRIGICVNVVDDSDHADRVNGYRDAMEARGIPLDERLHFRFPARPDGGVQLMRRIMTMEDRPTAVYIGDPMTALGAINEANSLGIKVPDEISIVGFDDGDMRNLVYPKMTAVCQDARMMGQAAFDALHEVLSHSGHPISVHRAMPTTFEVHESTSRPSPRD